MAKNSKSQKIGRRGESFAWNIFEELGYVCNDISNDFGEDFFVLGEHGEVIEPFKVFVQVKSSDVFEKYPSDWTEYCDPLTVRNWILSNELTVVVRINLQTKEARYCVPEDECEYWDIDYEKKFPIRLINSFDQDAARYLMWAARIRHYDRLVRLMVPDHFDSREFESIPRYRLFVLEFLSRLSILDASGQLRPGILEAYRRIFQDTEPEINESSSDMTRHEIIRYATCIQIIPIALSESAGLTIGLSPTLADYCACLLVQFIIGAEAGGDLPIAT